MRWMVGVLMVTALLSFDGFAASNADISGQWTVQDGKSRVEIYKTADGVIEGKVCWLQELAFPAGDIEAGRPKHDRKNPNVALRGRPILGLVIMKGFRFDGKKRWFGGTVYDPQVGWTYKGKISLVDGQTLDLRGFIGVSLLGRTEKWTRYTEPIK